MAQRLIVVAITAANAIGASIVMLLLFLVLPLPKEAPTDGPLGPLVASAPRSRPSSTGATGSRAGEAGHLGVPG
ncbi:MAG: hypothetical protein WKF94_12140 [Solirubrobacteraceae bacterium]